MRLFISIIIILAVAKISFAQDRYDKIFTDKIWTMSKSDANFLNDTILLYKVDIKDVSPIQDKYANAGFMFLPNGKFKRIVHGCNPAARRPMSWRRDGKILSIYIDKNEYNDKEKIWMQFEILKIRNATMLVEFKSSTSFH